MPRRAASFCRPSGLARPLPHGDENARAEFGALVEEHGDGPQQHVGGLQGLDAAREERDVQVHAGVDHGELVQVGRVVPC